AAEGMRFTHGYAAAAVCSPSRAAFMTGCYPARLGITDWIRPLAGTEWTEEVIRAGPEYVTRGDRPLLTPRNPRWMELEEVTLAELLQERGYATGFVGKWHLGPPGWFPEDQGFDVNRGGCDFGHPPAYFDPYPAKHQRTGFPNLAPRREGEYLTDREADEALAFIRAHADRPFLLVLCHYAVHSPIRGKPDLVAHYEGKSTPADDGQRHPAYAAMVHSVDEALGSILDLLEESGLTGNTFVVFTSDNGGATHFDATDNRPLRSGKGRPYEGGIRVPFIVRWPARVQPGETGAPVSSMDLLPTICDAIGINPPEDRIIDGVSFMPVLERSGVLEPRPLFWHFPHYWWGGRLAPYSIVRSGDWKLIRWYEGGPSELYDLRADPGETTNRALEDPARVRALEALLDNWLDETGAKRPRLARGRAPRSRP
ncbi:MAG: sulfatase, partial [Planctomycetota bacterium]